MNISTLIGFLASLAVFVAALLTTASNFLIFVNVHAVLIVVGGTLAASFVCFSLPKVFGLLKVFGRRMLGQSHRDYLLIADEIIAIANASRKGADALDQAVKKATDPFLRDAGEILFWLDAEVPQHQLRDLLEMRADTHFDRYMDEASIFQTIAKFPPAFGLMGTTLGMIALLQSLGDVNAKSQIGPSMAIALVATLYGIVLANFVFIPISENLKKQCKEDLVARRMVVEGIMMIAEGLPGKFVEEKVKSLLLPSERRQGSAGSAPTAKETRKAA